MNYAATLVRMCVPYLSSPLPPTLLKGQSHQVLLFLMVL
jgi:hypothetical protein